MTLWLMVCQKNRHCRNEMENSNSNMLNDENRVNNKNTYTQVPTGKSKQNKNRLMSSARRAMGNGSDKSERASHVINDLEKNILVNSRIVW